MIWPFKKSPSNTLGIDIGSSAIKVIELSKYGEQVKLANYGFAPISSFYEYSKERIIEDDQGGTLLFSAGEISEVLKLILRTAKIRTRRAVISIPDFATFFTSFTLPPMSKEEVPEAVQFEARRHVPLPLSEVTLDWSITKGTASKEKKEELEILLVVVPNQIINQYRAVSEACQFELLAVEAEVFGLQRSLVKDKKNTIALIDIGAQSTTCSIVDEDILKLSHSFDIGGNNFTQMLSKSLDLDYKTAEFLKIKQGIHEGPQKAKDNLIPLLDLMVVEFKKVIDNFYQREGKEIQSYMLAGASAFLPGLGEYLSKKLGKEILVADPFSEMVYPPILEQSLKQMGPESCIAVGMALKGLEISS